MDSLEALAGAVLELDPSYASSLKVKGWQGAHRDPVAHSIRLAHETWVYNLCTVAALAWISYDIILCLGQEVTLVWGRWHEPNGRHNRHLYIFVRYFSLLTLICHVYVNTRYNLPSNFCRPWHYAMMVATSLITSVPDLMILIRINSVYDWSISPLLITTAVFFMNLTTTLVVGIMSIPTMHLPSQQLIPLPGCYQGASLSQPLVTLGNWIPSIAGQCIYFVLMINTLTHVMKVLDENGKATIESWIQVRRLVPTMMIFIKHGMWYFFIGIMAKIVCAVLMTSAHGPLQLVGTAFLLAVYPILLSRVYLDMIAYLYTRKRTHRLEARAASLDSDDDDDDNGYIRFSYSSADGPKHGLEPISFATRSSMSFTGEKDLDHEWDLDSIRSPRRYTYGNLSTIDYRGRRGPSISGLNFREMEDVVPEEEDLDLESAPARFSQTSQRQRMQSGGFARRRGMSILSHASSVLTMNERERRRDLDMHYSMSRPLRGSQRHDRGASGSAIYMASEAF